MSISVVKETPKYIKWRYTSETGAGSIVLEKYGDKWNVELIRVSPQGKGIGSLLLNTARGRFPNESMTVCPVEEGVPFFKKHGALNGILPPLV